MIIFGSNEFDFDSTISYKQWVSTDKTSLVTLENNLNDFIRILTDKPFELCHHYFTNAHQGTYPKEGKALLDNHFAENYSFLVKDAIQSFYWQNQQATFHPFVVYHNDDDDDKLNCVCYHIISDHLLHDQTEVHCFFSLNILIWA